MLPTTHLAMGIQSKSVRGLGAELSVRSKAPHEPWLSWGGAPLTQEIFGTCENGDIMLFAFISKCVSEESKKMEKKSLKIISSNFGAKK